MALIVINVMAGKNKNIIQKIINLKLVPIPRVVIREKIVLISIICQKKDKLIIMSTKEFSDMSLKIELSRTLLKWERMMDLEDLVAR